MKVGDKFSTDKGRYEVKMEIPYKRHRIFYIEGIRKGLQHSHYEVNKDEDGTMFKNLSEAKALVDQLIKRR